jgi:hypothetical protein
MAWAGWTETMTSLAKYAILATIQKQWPLASRHGGDSVYSGVQQDKGLGKIQTDLPASSGVRIFGDAVAMLSMW